MCGPVGSADLTYRVATRTVSPHLPVTLSYITAASFTNYKHIWIGAQSTPLYLKWQCSRARYGSVKDSMKNLAISLSSKCVHGVLNVDVQGSIKTHSSNISDRITNKQCVFLIFWSFIIWIFTSQPFPELERKAICWSPSRTFFWWSRESIFQS